MATSSQPLRIFFLDVGQGDCTFIVPPTDEGAPILFDCADQYVAERFVANHGITDLAAVVVSHLDIDHVRGMLAFLKNHFAAGRRVRRLVVALDRIPNPDGDVNLRAFMAAALDWGRTPPHEGFVLKAAQRDGDGPILLAGGGSPGSDWRVELVLPMWDNFQSNLLDGREATNYCSAVLRVTRAGNSILIGGDAPLGSWERLEPHLRPAHAIRVPHHGGNILERGRDWRRYEDLYDAVRAESAVVSVGTNNAHHHPLAAYVTAAHRGHSCRMLCTQLTPRCHDDPLELRSDALEYAGLVEYPYRHRAVPGHPSRRPPGEVPCAGTVMIALKPDGSLDVEPGSGGHHDRLIEQVDHPLCQSS